MVLKPPYADSVSAARSRIWQRPMKFWPCRRRRGPSKTELDEVLRPRALQRLGVLAARRRLGGENLTVAELK